MARRRAEKARGKSVSAHGRVPRGRAKAAPADAALRERLTASERDREALRADLERLQARVRALEKTQADVRDRIAWAVDSLHNILDSKD
jgi:predicted  nucleic acid-binding Zn-ribbon protein